MHGNASPHPNMFVQTSQLDDYFIELVPEKNTTVVVEHNMNIEFYKLEVNFLFKFTVNGPNIFEFGDTIRMNSAGYPIGQTANQSYGVIAYTAAAQDGLNQFTLALGDEAMYTWDPAGSDSIKIKWDEGNLCVYVKKIKI